MHTIGVAIIEDHGIVRQGLRALLEREEDLEVVGEAENGEAAVRLVQERRPDVVIMDIAMPGMDGIQATQAIKEAVPEVQVIALTIHEEDEFVLAMMRAGADGYVLKHSVVGELVQAIRTVSQGQAVFSPTIARKLAQRIEERALPSLDAELGAVTDRERDILQLMAAGATSREIGNKLHLSSKTVDNYRSNIIAKLGARNQIEAVVIALRKGMITP